MKPPLVLCFAIGIALGIALDIALGTFLGNIALGMHPFVMNIAISTTASIIGCNTTTTATTTTTTNTPALGKPQCAPFAEHVRKFDEMVQENQTYSNDSFCPCCGAVVPKFESFTASSGKTRVGAKCPKCGALERHRRACLNLVDTGVLIPRKSARQLPFRILHFGPQTSMEVGLDAVCPDARVDQVGVDFNAQGHSLAKRYHYSNKTYFADVTALGYPDDFFDAVIILHVLEHVPDTMRALHEMRRVLRKGGHLITETPCHSEKKDAQTQDCRLVNERKGLCVQVDHVWDFNCQHLAGMIAQTGFACKVKPDEYSRPEVRRVVHASVLSYTPQLVCV